MTRQTLPLCAALLGLALVGPVRADTVTLTNGSQIHGKIVGESETTLRIKTGGGVMEVARDKVRSVERNDRGLDQPKPQPRPSETPEEPEAPETPQPDPGPGGGDAAALREELAALGPSAEERLAAAALSADERAELNALLATMGRTTRRGTNPQQARASARDQLVAKFGVKAVPALAKELGGTNYWRTRLAVEALGPAVAGDAEAGRWLAHHHDVPGKLIELLGHEAEAGLSPALRAEASQALHAVTGEGIAWPASEEQAPSAAERKAQGEWRTWWRAAQRDWRKREQDQAKRRAELRKQLGLR